MKFSLSNEEMKLAIENTVKDLEKNLILRLSAIGIDFEEFDPNSFIFNDESAAHDGIKKLIIRIENLKVKLENL